MTTLAAIASGIRTPFIYGATLTVLAAGLLLLNDFLSGRRRKKGSGKGASRPFADRLSNPDFDGLEKHFGHPLPPGLRALYANRQEISSEEIEISGMDAAGKEMAWHIAFYQPADLENVQEAWPDTKDVFEFANDGCGNGYTIDPRLDDPPVMFYDHETGEWEQVAESFSRFMAMKRRQK